MPNYQEGKIYKIVNDVDDEIYVGSTCNTLAKRFGDHKSSITKRPKYKIYQKMSEMGVNNFRIILVENYPVDYQQGKIYKIVSDSTDKIYIGSTTLPKLSSRIAQHRITLKRCQNNPKLGKCTSFEILQYPDSRIVLVENHPVLIRLHVIDQKNTMHNTRKNGL